MAKLSLAAIAAAFMLLIVAEASVRTTVIIDEEDSNQSEQGKQQQCKQEIRQLGSMRYCQEFIKQQVQQQGRQSRDEENYYYYYNQQQQGQQQYYDECCNELRQLSDECTCRGVEKALSKVQKQLQGGQLQGLEQVRRMVQGLPGRCGTQPSQCGGSVAAWI